MFTSSACGAFVVLTIFYIICDSMSKEIGRVSLVLYCSTCMSFIGRGKNTGFYGDKILNKNLKFFDKIFVPTFCRRRFRNALYGEKILSMEKCNVWARFRQTNLFMLIFYAGRYKN